MDADFVNRLSTDQSLLFEELGRELLGDGRGISTADRNRQRDFGRSWFDSWLRKNKEALCSDPRVIAITTHSEASTQAQELAAVADVLASLAGVPPPATVALILVKRGLLRICS